MRVPAFVSRGRSPRVLFHGLSEPHVAPKKLVDNGGEVLFLFCCYGLNEGLHFLVKIDGKVQFRVGPENLAPFGLRKIVLLSHDSFLS